MDPLDTQSLFDDIILSVERLDSGSVFDILFDFLSIAIRLLERKTLTGPQKKATALELLNLFLEHQGHDKRIREFIAFAAPHLIDTLVFAFNNKDFHASVKRRFSCLPCIN